MDGRRPLVFIIADYGAGDLAFSEVRKQILYRVDADVSSINVPSFNTMATGFCIYQLSLNGTGKGIDGKNRPNTYIFSNTAPRRDKPGPRKDNEGEQLTYARLKNGLEIMTVISGESLSFVKSMIKELRAVKVVNYGSQFRSRDKYPMVLAQIIKGDYSSLGKKLSMDRIPTLDRKRIAYIDGYGNIKLTTRHSDVRKLRPGDQISITIEGKSMMGVFSEGMFGVKEGVLCVSPGSSGPIEDRLIQISIRLGNAWERLGKPKTGAEIVIRKAFSKL